MKRSLLSLSFILFSLRLLASHIAGGEIRYEFNGTNYTVYLSILGDCNATSTPLGGTIPINFTSVSTGKSFTRQFTLSSADYITQTCTSNPCSPPAVFPGYGIGTAVDTVTLPPATDWIISIAPGSARSFPVNLQGQGTNFYVEATLNNSSGPNSSPKLPDWPTVYIANYFPVYFPIKAVDLDGDSIAYELIAPMIDGTTAAQYAVGYTPGSPLGSGSVYKITNNRSSIELLGGLIGSHALALKIKEYRNNNLIASYMREFTASVTNTFTSQQTIPLPSASSVLDIYTCPGQNNNIIINFIDSTATDSVFVTVQPPVITGWIFNANTSAAPGTGSAIVSWTTPLSANPNTLKQFTIKLRARDNTCPVRSIVDYYVTVRLQPCSADSVWPGDANDDHTVDLYDPLAIAIANGKTGPARPGANTSWTPQYCATWTNNFITNNANMKHADCNGDGTVSATDLSAVSSNYGQFHLKGGEQEKTTGVPELYFDLTNVILLPGAPASIPIRIGNTANTVSNLYGVASRIKIDGLNLGAVPSVNAINSWIGNSSNTLNFIHPVSTSTVDWTHARINQQEVTGHGVAGTLNFTVPTTAMQGQTVNLSFELSRLINKEGDNIAFNAVNASLKVGFPDNVADVYLRSGAFIAPNPSANAASLYVASPGVGSLSVSISNTIGQYIWKEQYNVSSGNQTFALPADITPGVYYVHLHGPASTHTIKWIKQQ